jgi:hypothetical protein
MEKNDAGQSILEQYFDFTYNFDAENEYLSETELLHDSDEEKATKTDFTSKRELKKSTLTENITLNSNKNVAESSNYQSNFTKLQVSGSRQVDSTYTESLNFLEKSDCHNKKAPLKPAHLNETVNNKRMHSNYSASFLSERPYDDTRHDDQSQTAIVNDLADRQNTKRFLRQNNTLLRDFFCLEDNEILANIKKPDPVFDNQNNQDEDEDDAQLVQNSTCMCMIYQGQRFACTVYDYAAKSLSYLPDCEDNSSFSLANMLISDLQPDTVITCTTGDEDFVKYLKVKCKYNNLDDNNENFLRSDANKNPNEDESQNSIRFVMMANADFSYQYACEQILRIDTLEEMSAMVVSEQERIIYMKSLINFDLKHMIRCMGALLTYLQRSVDNNGDELQTESVPILNIRAIKLDKLLAIDHNTYKSLQIFNDVDLNFANRQAMPQFAGHFRSTLNFKIHAHSTLYSLFLSKIHTKVGIAKLRSFMLRPVRDWSVINERHKLIEFFIDRRSQKFVELLRKSLRKCKFINALFKKMRMSTCSLNEWRKLYHTTVSLYDLARLAEIGSNEFKKLDQQSASQARYNSTNMNNCLESSRSRYFSSESFGSQFSSNKVSVKIVYLINDLIGL